MGDVSVFMKELKQRFSKWFNKERNRFGTLWAERFKSVLVEDQPGVVQTVAAYVDLNPVRAGLVKDPKDYRWCGYAEAVGGNETARRGLASVHRSAEWSAASSGPSSTPAPSQRSRSCTSALRFCCLLEALAASVIGSRTSGRD
jgi:hypothetical protein